MTICFLADKRTNNSRIVKNEQSLKARGCYLVNRMPSLTSKLECPALKI